MKTNKLIIPLLFISIFVLFQCFVYRAWLFNGQVLTSGDWMPTLGQTSKEFLIFPQVWKAVSFGGIDLTPSFYPFLLIMGLLNNFNIQYPFIERIIFMWPILIALPVVSYLFIKKNINNSIAAVIGSLVYSFNTYFSVIKTGHLTLLMSYAVVPLVFLFYQKALEKRSIKYSLLAGIFGFICSFYEFRIFYILCFILFFYFIYYLFYIEKIKNIYDIIKICFFAGLPAFIDLLLNLYWLLPLGKIGALSSNAIFDRSLFGNEFLNINYAITLFHPFWTGSKAAIFIVQNIPVYFWLIPFFAFLGFILNKKNKQILFFGLIALLGVFLTKQVGHPFIDIYLWLYKHFPGFNAFREASKFYFLITFAYSVLIAGFVDWLWRNWTKTKSKIFGKYIIIGVIALIFLWNTKPFITGEIGTLFVPREIPNDYSIVNDFFLRQGAYFRTFWIPVTSRWAVYVNNHPVVSAVDTINAEWNFFIKNKRNDRILEAELAIDSLTSTHSSNLLNQSSIKYIVIPLEDKLNDDDFFVFYGKQRQYYIDELNKLKNLHKVNIGTKEIIIYENYNYKPHIYITNNKETISKEQAYKTIEYNFINPTEYRFFIKNVSTPFYFNFSENYHPDWKIKIGNFNWVDVLTKSNYFIADKNHLKNDAGLNSYYINPTVVCNVHKVNNVYKVGNGCVRNADGSYDISGTLYFKPQSYMYLGIIISGGTFVLIFGCLVLILGRYIKNERKN